MQKNINAKMYFAVMICPLESMRWFASLYFDEEAEILEVCLSKTTQTTWFRFEGTMCPTHEIHLDDVHIWFSHHFECLPVPSHFSHNPCLPALSNEPRVEALCKRVCSLLPNLHLKPIDD
jgi:hypothetical protein